MKVRLLDTDKKERTGEMIVYTRELDEPCKVRTAQHLANHCLVDRDFLFGGLC